MSQDSFIKACENGALKKAKARLAAGGVDVDRKGRWCHTALTMASVNGHLHTVRWLVEDAHASVDVAGYHGSTPFWYACNNGELQVAAYLYSCGAIATKTSNNGTSPFWVACYYGYLHVTRWLAEDIGVDVSQAPFIGANRGTTPFAFVRMDTENIVTPWLTSFLVRRVLIAYWSVGRARYRAYLPALGNTVEAVWRRLPRQAMAEVLLLLLTPSRSRITRHGRNDE